MVVPQSHIGIGGVRLRVRVREAARRVRHVPCVVCTLHLSQLTYFCSPHSGGVLTVHVRAHGLQTGPMSVLTCDMGQYGVTVGAKLKPEVSRSKSVTGGFGLLHLQFKSEPGQAKRKEDSADIKRRSRSL